MLTRSCNKCGAVFNFEDIEKLKEHLKNCTREEPFLDDENAIRYEEELQQ